MNQASKPLRDRRREALRDDILAAAERVMAAQGVATATMQAIAEGAGVSVGTLYNHFEDRDEILGALFEARRNEIAARLEDAWKAGARAPFEQRLSTIVRAVIDHFDAHPDFVRIAHEAEQIRSRPSREGGSPPTPVLVEQYFENLAAHGVQKGILRAADAASYAAALWGILRGVLIRALAGATRDAEKETSFVVQLFLRGAAK
jgi:AcrR family transcriptional regulator